MSSPSDKANNKKEVFQRKGFFSEKALLTIIVLGIIRQVPTANGSSEDFLENHIQQHRSESYSYK